MRSFNNQDDASETATLIILPFLVRSICRSRSRSVAVAVLLPFHERADLDPRS